ncbi:unnamed protein product [Rotaria sp. Silwood1]|nr:unnamed protein product [Rotaria sp. Silwood1]CAF3906203.1 unnamed protein product [Rotaria sp. Silwood1]CAF5027373.1 unnamed protein product [Rotaria sp. Silwood1]
MMPATTSDPTDKWILTIKSEIRVKLMLTNDDVKELARGAIVKKYNLTMAEYSKFWDVTPLMIDSLTAYIIGGTRLPVEGVIPYATTHPNQLTMQFRFDCSSEERAKEVVEKIIDDVKPQIAY